MYSLLDYDTLFRVCLKSQIFQLAKNPLSEYDVVEPAYVARQKSAQSLQGQSAVNGQVVELLRQWQRSEEGRMAQKWYREGKKLIILRPGQ